MPKLRNVARIITELESLNNQHLVDGFRCSICNSCFRDVKNDPVLDRMNEHDCRYWSARYCDDITSEKGCYDRDD